MTPAQTLRITEIFHSLQGETRTAGLPTVFVRLTGCPLRCGYCDTAYAFSGGELRTLDAIVEEVRGHAPRFVTVTGGEPLAQPECLPLLERLLDEPGMREVSLETSGALDVSGVDARVVKVLDLKTPGSGESHRNLWSNLEHLTERDQIKFVVCDRADYEWARLQIDTRDLAERVDEVLLSPSHGVVDPAELAGWILEDRLDVRMQLQMHKYLWGDEPGH
ncbi:MAG: 7-carboxy-7-deazaguanine synthase QueE [Pseudomonadales bacterium]|jgi:7-carboxy-7-deazaguanine synthase|nr:7-carboxy-7-deazaguanine synthase QueE [Pseudomonadales bacterium]